MFRRRKPLPQASESHTALKEAQETLDEIKARGPEVRELSQRLRIMRERNHFAETLQTIIEGGRP